MRRLTIAVGFTGLVCLAACAPPDDQAASRRQVEAALVHYNSLTRQMLGDSIAALYTPDGELLGTNAPTVRGPDSIRAFLARFAGKVTVDSARMWSDAITVAGSEAVQWGRYEQFATPVNQPQVHVQGRFVADWVRDSTGAWRLRRMLAQPAPLGR